MGYHYDTSYYTGARYTVVFTMEYVTSREIGRAQRLFSNLKDAFGYFGIRAFLRGRGRAGSPRPA